MSPEKQPPQAVQNFLTLPNLAERIGEKNAVKVVRNIMGTAAKRLVTEWSNNGDSGRHFLPIATIGYSDWMYTNFIRVRRFPLKKFPAVVILGYDPYLNKLIKLAMYPQINNLGQPTAKAKADTNLPIIYQEKVLPSDWLTYGNAVATAIETEAKKLQGKTAKIICV